MRALNRCPVKTKLGKQINYSMARHKRLTALREKILSIHDEEKKLRLFDDFITEDFTLRLIIQKQNSRPVRPVK